MTETSIENEAERVSLKRKTGTWCWSYDVGGSN